MLFGHNLHLLAPFELLGRDFAQNFAARLGCQGAQKCFPKGPLLGRPNLSADKTYDVSADRTSVVSAAEARALSAGKTSLVSQVDLVPLPTRLPCGRLRDAPGTSREITDFLFAEKADVSAADNRCLSC